MSPDEIWQAFVAGMVQTRWIEYIAVFAGILSVWFSRKENILVYPVGLINTIFYVYISISGQLYGEAAVNLYYTIMSVYGWWLWDKKNTENKPALKISYSTKKEWIIQLIFFAFIYAIIFTALSLLKKEFAPGVLPWADGLASASAFTGMWLMTRKKVESWIWWIITNIASIPLYFVKGYVFTSVYYLVLLALAVAGLIEWRKRIKYES